MFEDVRQAKSVLLFIVSSTEPIIFKQSGVVDHEKNLALQNIHRQRSLKEYVALHLLDKSFLFTK